MISAHALSLRGSITPKLATIAGSFLMLVVFLLSHLGTYDVALTRLPTWPDRQVTAQARTINAAKALIRLDQASMSQYSSKEQHDTWSASTCSAASVTEVIDSYGHTYKIADILTIEAGIGAITPDQGLLYPEGIDQTAATLHFATQTLNTPTLDQVLALANGGKPVIVNFPPETWSGGHFLVVLGGSTIEGVAYVHLADSSTLNMQYMKRDRFLSYWKGLAKVLTPQPGSTISNQHYAVTGKPTLTASFINTVLALYHSPAEGKGQALYDLGVQDGIDPAFALAFFFHESTLGTKGEASTTLSLGNLRCIKNAACVNTVGNPCQSVESCYAAFPTWEAGFQAWYALILQGYIQGNINQVIGRKACPCTTIEQIIPIYAPVSDHNDEQAYIDSLAHSLDVWHSGQLHP